MSLHRDLRERGPDRAELRPRLNRALPFLLVGQVTMACVGGDVIERSLASGSDAALAEAVGALGWRDLMTFVSGHAHEGRIGRALVVDEGETEDQTREAFAKALRAIGADVPGGGVDPVLSRTALPPDRGAELGIAAVLEYCIAAGPPHYIATFSPALDRQAQLAELPPGADAVLGPLPEAKTPREFLTWLMSKVDDQWPSAAAAKSGGWIRRVSPPQEALLVIVGGPHLSFITDGLKGKVAAAEIALVIDLTEAGVETEIRALVETQDRRMLYWRPTVG